MRTPKQLVILSYPIRRVFPIDSDLVFYGLLCKCIYTDGTEEFIDDPYIEYTEPTMPGTYKATVYLDDKHTADVHTYFKFQVIENEAEYINRLVAAHKCEL